MRFGVLGPLQVTVSGTDVPIGSAMQRRLLAALLVSAGRVVSTDRLLAVLWGDAPPATALRSLRTYVYRLRDALGDGGASLTTRPPGYLLDVDPGRVDAGRFEHLLAAGRETSDPRARRELLDEALRLWRGPAFAEFADDDFARPEALRLEELHRVATEERFDVQLSLGQHAATVGEIEAFVHRHPLRERAQAQLMTALYRCGRQADALAAYRGFRDLLGDELGLEVPATLVALERDILRQALPEPDTTAPSATPHRPTAVAPPTRHPRLPTETSPLVGREGDVERVRALMADHRVVTITGVGGVGKTRLALQLAHRAAGHHDDEAWWCELAPVGHEDEVVDAVATALGVRPGDDTDVTGMVVAFLRSRDAVVVLDNCEHVAPAVADLVRELVRTCPGITVLTTSRTRLGVPGERVHRLAPLETADQDATGSHGGPALELFLERCRGVRPELEADPAERARLAELCRQLDGLPLAIELAASRLRSLNPVDLLARLDDRLDLIAEVGREGGRHGGLRAVLDWSYGLLTTVEQRLFARLSVFAGSFTLEACEQVAAGDGIATAEVLDLLARLVEHDLVQLVPSGGTTRYVLLETLRAYGRERLEETGEVDDLRRRHAEYHVALAEAADVQVRSREEALGVTRLDRALDNLRAAHRWATSTGDVEISLRLCAALFRYAMWRLRTEVLTWASEAARLPGAHHHAAFATVAGMAGWAAALRGDLEEAEAWAGRGLDAVGEDADGRMVPLLEVRMHLALWQGHLDACLDHARRAAAVADDPYELIPRYVPVLALTYAGRPSEALDLVEDVQRAADRHGNPSIRSLVRYTRGEALLAVDPPRALRPLQEAAELAAAVDNRIVLGVVDVSLVSLQARYGRTDEALDTFVTVIDRLHEGGDWTHLWTGLRGLVDVLARVGCDEDAAVVLGAVREAENAPPPYGEDAERLTAVEIDLARRLGRTRLGDAQARGHAMTDHEAIAFARGAIERARSG